MKFWNSWRSESKEIPDLSNADLKGLNLERLGLANAQGMDLTSANLEGADLTNSNLRGSDFTLASLHRTNFTNSDLRETYFHHADLTSANLTGADVRGADFTRATLRNANLAKAKFQYTGLDFVNLSNVIGLEDCEHYGPSDIGFRTLTESENLPTGFLRGCGLSDQLIEYVRSVTSKAIQFHSCFLSYSHSDNLFADKIYEELQKNNIRCWKDDHSMRLGENILDGVGVGIHISDKSILLCSRSSLESRWVKDEIDKALEKEYKLQKEKGKSIIVLIPIIIDDYLSDWIDGRATFIRSRLYGDFREWKNEFEFKKSFKRLLDSLHSKNFDQIGFH